MSTMPVTGGSFVRQSLRRRSLSSHCISLSLSLVAPPSSSSTSTHSPCARSVDIQPVVSPNQNTGWDASNTIPTSAFSLCGGMVAIKLPPTTVEISADAFVRCNPACPAPAPGLRR